MKSLTFSPTAAGASALPKPITTRTRTYILERTLVRDIAAEVIGRRRRVELGWGVK